MARTTLVVVLALVSDQLLKLFARLQIPECRQPAGLFMRCPSVGIAGPIALVHVENVGSGMRWFRTNGEAIVLGVIAVVAVAIYASLLSRVGWPGAGATGLQLGGALGNLLDHVVRGSASDAIRLSAWYTFDFADFYVVIGGAMALGCLALVLLRPATTRGWRPP